MTRRPLSCFSRSSSWRLLILTPLAFITGQTTFHIRLSVVESRLSGGDRLLRELPRLELPPEGIPRGAPRSARLHDPDLRRHSLGAAPRGIGRHAVCLRVAPCARRPPSHAGEDDSARQEARILSSEPLILAEYAVFRNVKRLCFSLNGETLILTENQLSPGLRGFLMSETDTKFVTGEESRV